jgi:hypothetical protein
MSPLHRYFRVRGRVRVIVTFDTIATISEPLNRPEWCPESKVVDGRRGSLNGNDAPDETRDSAHTHPLPEKQPHMPQLIVRP